MLLVMSEEKKLSDKPEAAVDGDTSAWAEKDDEQKEVEKEGVAGAEEDKEVDEMKDEEKVEMEKKEVVATEEDKKDDEEKVEEHKMDVDEEVVKENQPAEEDDEGEGGGKEKDARSEAMDEDEKEKPVVESDHKVKKENKKENVEKKEVKVETGSKKLLRPKSNGRKEDDSKNEEVKEKEVMKTSSAPLIQRPQRKRKSVERLVASIEKDSGKEFHIEGGRGTALKDIPNVQYKLTRKKSDETFKLLHTILFGRRGKAAQLKSNLSRFSGFVWRDDEEKQKIKVKVKLDKCFKEKLLEVCDVLDIPITKSTTRKEDIVAKLMEFLEAPHATTPELLAEKEQGKKHKKVGTSRSASRSSSSKLSTKSKKRADSASRKDERIPESEEEEKERDQDVDGVAGSSEDEMSDHTDSEEKEEEFEGDKQKKKHAVKKSSAKKETAAKAAKKAKTQKSSPPSKQSPFKTSFQQPKPKDDHDKGTKTLGEQQKTEVVEAQEKSATSWLSTGKIPAKGNEGKLIPSNDELKDAVCDILPVVDFNTVTFTDILKHLGKQFKTDLTPRKLSIKLMIEEELSKLGDYEEDGSDDE